MTEHQLKLLMAKTKWLIVELEDVLETAHGLQSYLSGVAEAHSAAEQPRMAPVAAITPVVASVSTTAPDRGVATAFPVMPPQQPTWMLQRGAIMLPTVMVHGQLVELVGGPEQAGL